MGERITRRGVLGRLSGLLALAVPATWLGQRAEAKPADRLGSLDMEGKRPSGKPQITVADSQQPPADNLWMRFGDATVRVGAAPVAKDKVEAWSKFDEIAWATHLNPAFLPGLLVFGFWHDWKQSVRHHDAWALTRTLASLHRRGALPWLHRAVATGHVRLLTDSVEMKQLGVVTLCPGETSSGDLLAFLDSLIDCEHRREVLAKNGVDWPMLGPVVPLRELVRMWDELFPGTGDGEELGPATLTSEDERAGEEIQQTLHGTGWTVGTVSPGPLEGDCLSVDATLVPPADLLDVGMWKLSPASVE